MTAKKELLRLLLVWVATHFLLVTVVFHPEMHWDNPTWDVRLYYYYANLMLDGKAPYKDFSPEYPPLALPFFVLPRLFSHDFNSYLQIYNLEVLAVEVATLVVILGIIYRCSLDDERRPHPLYAYILLVSSSGQIFLNRYDALPAFLVTLSIYLYVRGDAKSAWAILACSVMTKVYPIILAPLFILTYFRGGKWRVKECLSGVVTFAGSLTLISLPFLLIAGENVLLPFVYHVERGIQLESTYASLLLWLHQMLGLPVSIVFPFRSYEVLSPSSLALSQLALPIMLISQLGLYLLFFGSLRKGKEDGCQQKSDDAPRLIRFSLLSTLSFLLSYKVFSPQFLAWLFPLVALMKGSRRAEKNITAIFIVACGLTQIIFPLAYDQLVDLSGLVILVLLLRNLLLVACLLLVMNWKSGDGLLSRLHPLVFTFAGAVLLFAGLISITLLGWSSIYYLDIPVCHPGILFTIGLNLVLCSFL